MRTIKRKADTILIADDEPFNLEWAVEYLRSKGYNVLISENVDHAYTLLQKTQFRATIIDLSIPVLQAALKSTAPLPSMYPGLILAEYARNHGHLGRQVVVYSVHDDPAVREYTRKIGCTYLLKGRPRQFKNELDAILAYDPLATKTRKA